MYVCLYRPPALDAYGDQRSAALVALAADFSPRYERHRDDLVSIDVSGLGRLLGPARAIGEELRREAAARGVRVHVALAGTRIAALVLVHTRPGLTLVEPGEEAAALAPLPIGILEKIATDTMRPRPTPEAESLGSRPARDSLEPLRSANALSNSAGGGAPARVNRGGAPREVKNADGLLVSPVRTLKSWGLRPLGELAALPPADLAARLGSQGLVWQAIARGEDVGPLVPDVPEERFESSIELEWPIDGLEPLSFVLTRLLEPLSTRLERRDRGAAVLHVMLGLVTRDIYTRSLQLPSPIRDVRTLRTLALLDLESHPPTGAIDRVTLVIDPTPGRVLQQTLFTRAHPTPEQLSTLLARLGALMGQDRIGAAALGDSYRPGAFAMAPFATEHPSPERESLRSSARRGERVGVGPHARQENVGGVDSMNPNADTCVTQTLRRCRHPVPARVVVADGRPVRVTTDRRGFVGGQVLTCAGPWRTSGEWWSACGPREAGRAGGAGTAGRSEGDLRRPVLDTREHGARGPSEREDASEREWGPTSHERAASASGVGAGPHASKKWNRDEWDVALNDGAVYRIFRDRETDGWFIDAIAD